MSELPSDKQQQPKLKEYEDVYFKMERVINGCDTIPQLEMFGDRLVEIFRKNNFKRDKISKKDQERMTYQLIETVRKKKTAIRFRIHHEKKSKKE